MIKILHEQLKSWRNAFEKMSKENQNKTKLNVDVGHVYFV